MSGEFSLRPRITVIGVGGAGCNAVNNMIRAQLEGVDFLVANTDAQSLDQSLVELENRIQLGPDITKGLGAGSRPDVGQSAAEESSQDVLPKIQNSNMVFITAGMGGGTGTGAAPVIARIAKEAGILTVGVVTRPFYFEGAHRANSAEQGITELQKYVDTLIVIPNQNLFRVANEQTTFADAFKMADEVLYSGVRGVTDLMIMPGLINLDFSDVRTVMAQMGNAMMGTGEGEGERRALDAAEAAISNPLLDDVSMKGAKGVLINITGGYDMTLFEVDEATNRVREDVDSEANIIFGSTFDERLNGKIRVSVVATGIGQPKVEEVVETKPEEPEEQVGFNGIIRKTFGGGSQSFSARNSLYTNMDNAVSSAPEDQAEVNAFISDEQPELQTGSSATSSGLIFEDSSHETPTYQPELIGSQAPQRNFQQYNAQPQSVSKNEPNRRTKISLLERLTGVGRKNHPRYEEQSIKKENISMPDEDINSLEIPAFLRRDNSKKAR